MLELKVRAKVKEVTFISQRLLPLCLLARSSIHCYPLASDRVLVLDYVT